MAVKKVEYKQNLALLMACLSLLIFGGLALYQNGGITYDSLIASGAKIIPSVAIMYALGWIAGLIIESSKTVKKANLGYTNSLLEEILKEEGLDNLDESDFADELTAGEDDIDIEIKE